MAVGDAESSAELQREIARLQGELAAALRREAEGLAREAAAGEILRVIAGSPTDLQVVLDAMAESAARVCEADNTVIYRVEGDHVRAVAFHVAVGDRARYEQDRETPRPLNRRTVTGRAIVDGETVHVHDFEAAVEDEFPDSKQYFQALGHRTVLNVPLLHRGVPLGAIAVVRMERRPFTEQQIELVQTFADQAVIAIENARLFSELADLNRTLEARVNEQVEELERVGRLRRYLAPQLADLIVSSGDESILESHRRLITVVFCDLRGFTAFAEVAEPEEVMAVLAEYHAALGGLIHEHGGTIEQFTGDGVMVFFNDPLPQPDHAERAVRMAVAMRALVAELGRRWRRQGHRLDFGVGIAMGYATLGRIGFEGRFDYAAIGTVSNLAARLCGEAAGGQILISGRVLGVVEELVAAEELGDLTLKGFHRPVDAFNVLSLREADAAVANQDAGQVVEDA